MSDPQADRFTALLFIYLWRHEPERAASGVWFWPFEDAVLDTMASYRN